MAIEIVWIHAATWIQWGRLEFYKITTAKRFSRNSFPTVTLGYPQTSPWAVLFGTVSSESCNRVVSGRTSCCWVLLMQFISALCSTNETFSTPLHPFGGRSLRDEYLKTSADKNKTICMTLMSKGETEKMFCWDLVRSNTLTTHSSLEHKLQWSL